MNLCDTPNNRITVQLHVTTRKSSSVEIFFEIRQISGQNSPTEKASDKLYLYKLFVPDMKKYFGI